MLTSQILSRTRLVRTPIDRHTYISIPRTKGWLSQSNLQQSALYVRQAYFVTSFLGFAKFHESIFRIYSKGNQNWIEPQTVSIKRSGQPFLTFWLLIAVWDFFLGNHRPMKVNNKSASSLNYLTSNESNTRVVNFRWNSEPFQEVAAFGTFCERAHGKKWQY